MKRECRYLVRPLRIRLRDAEDQVTSGQAFPLGVSSSAVSSAFFSVSGSSP